MVQALGRSAKKIALASTFLGLCSLSTLAQEDPPSRVARLNYLTGNVSMEPAGVDEWAPAVVNRPFTTGDYLYADQGAQAELHMDVAAMRMGPNTSFGFLNLNDQTVQIKLSEGDMYFRLYNFGPDQVFEVDTPNAAVTLLRDGIYRFRVDPNGNMSFVVVRQGQAEITGGGQAFTLNPGNSAMLTGTNQLSYDIELAPVPDEFDNWCEQRDEREAHLASARYLPPTVIGYEDLDGYGDWQSETEYGPVWYPRTVVVGWAPYHYGHWVWVDPWGWTWVDDMPWGFAPFHYGRWAYVRGRWGWCPGPIAVVGHVGPVIRPYYAPAMVAWFGGAHWGVSFSAGGPSVGWVPLGFGEVYTPSYVCSQRYFNNVNVYNTRVVNNVNITNVYNTVYVNHTVYNREFVNVRAPNAVVAMPQSAFATGRPVREAGLVVRQADLVRVQPQAAVIAPPVAPTRQAFVPTAGRPAARPPAQIIQRQVVARNIPPAAPAPLAVRQSYLQQHAGQPFNYQALHQAVAPHVAPVALVRQAPPARPVQVQPGQRVGNTAAFNRPARVQQQNHPSPQSQPQSYQASRPPQPPSTPAAHGVPPNIHPNNTAQPPQNGHFAERTPPPRGHAAERIQGQPAVQPNFPERTQPRNEARPAPSVRAEAHGAPPPQNVERSQPHNENRPAPAAPKAEVRGSEGQPHGAPTQHQEHKDTSKDKK
jgi:hypothetical protein